MADDEQTRAAGLRRIDAAFAALQRIPDQQWDQRCEVPARQVIACGQATTRHATEGNMTNNAKLMGGSAIKWTDWSVTFWMGCTKISCGCLHCFAWAQDELRFKRVQFGNHPRVRTSDANWMKAFRYNAEAALFEWRPIVFANVCSDFFDNQADPAWRAEAWEIIRRTRRLLWIILTKRPMNIPDMLPPDWGAGYPNVILGVSVENQREAERRIPALLAVPARRYALSCEPLLEPLDLRRWLPHFCWVIVGGESVSPVERGAKPRYMEPDWARSIRDQCEPVDGCAFLMKQMTGGEKVPIPEDLLIEQYPT
jgi:protein gp37